MIRLETSGYQQDRICNVIITILRHWDYEMQSSQMITVAVEKAEQSDKSRIVLEIEFADH